MSLNVVTLLYLVAVVCFIQVLKGLALTPPLPSRGATTNPHLEWFISDSASSLSKTEWINFTSTHRHPVERPSTL